MPAQCGSKADKIPRRFQVKRPACWNEADSVPHVATFSAGVGGPVRKRTCVHSPVPVDLAERCEPAQSPVRLLSLMPLYASAGSLGRCSFDYEVRAGLPTDV